MADLRSLILVDTELAKLGIRPLDIAMGEAHLDGVITPSQQLRLRLALHKGGLQLLEDKKDILVHRVRQAITDYINNSEHLHGQILSVYLASVLEYDYTYMSNVFSQRTDTTIEHLFICQRIERVKRLLLFEDLSLGEISRIMQYCNPAYLSSQFKKVTGLTASAFKAEHRNKLPKTVDCG